MISFNVEQVYEYLKVHGEVYTLRKPRKDRRGVAIKGNWYKPKDVLGYVSIEPVIGRVTSSKTLIPYITKSGLDNPDKWLKLAKKLSGNRLTLYHVKVIPNP